MALTIIRKPVAPNNYHRGRNGHPIIAIVIHIEDGTEAGTDSWFDDPTSHVSSHYSVRKDGEIHQYVDDMDTAQHAGKVVRPSWQGYLTGPQAGVSPNDTTLGIEHEGRGGEAMTPAQFEASAQLIADRCLAHNLPVDEQHVIPHHAIRADKTCPGIGFDISALIVRALSYYRGEAA